MFWLLQNGTQNYNLPRQVKQTRKFRILQPGSSGFEITMAFQAKQRLQEGSRKILGEESSQGQERQAIKQHQAQNLLYMSRKKTFW